MAAKKILIADDDQNLLLALSVRLEAEGYDVVRAQDAYQALERTRQTNPDLLLLDINMPAGNGFSVQERIANIDELSSTPIIYITGEDSDRVNRTAQELGAFAVVPKPFETEDLLETIRAAMGNWAPENSCTGSG